jgi:uncharacterized membrane protein YeiH
MTTLSPLYILDISAVAVCAVTGTLEAGRRQMDLFGVMFVALVAAVGGGTVRDLMLGCRVFWLADQTYAVVAVLAAVATFFTARLVRLPANAFLMPDAFGLGLFTVLGTQKALAFHLPWFLATLMGVTTGVVGGVLRDVLCNEIPLIFRTQLYATVSWLGAVLLIVSRLAGVAPAGAEVLAVFGIVTLRLAAIQWGLRLPRFRSLPDRAL